MGTCRAQQKSDGRPDEVFSLKFSSKLPTDFADLGGTSTPGIVKDPQKTSSAEE